MRKISFSGAQTFAAATAATATTAAARCQPDG